jgi:hypothetical protein
LIEQVCGTRDSRFSSARKRRNHYLLAALATQRHVGAGFLFRKRRIDTGLGSEEPLRRLQYFGRTVTGGRFLKRSIAL